MGETTKLNKNADANMTHRVGTIFLDRSALTEALGKPHEADECDGKVTMEWFFDTPAGVATIYDYWWNREGEWSVGGHTENVVRHVQTYIEKKLGISIETHLGNCPPSLR